MCVASSSDKEQKHRRCPPSFFKQAHKYQGMRSEPLEMFRATLTLGGAAFSLGHRALVAKCNLFASNPTLAASPYRVRSPVPLCVFRQFLEAIEDKAVEVTNEHISSISQLCAEFGFHSFSSRLSAFRDSSACTDSADAEARSRISALEERNIAAGTTFLFAKWESCFSQTWPTRAAAQSRALSAQGLRRGSLRASCPTLLQRIWRIVIRSRHSEHWNAS
jgi:hypothetical protein